MTLQTLIADLKAAGCNENTLILAMNCYEQGCHDTRQHLAAELQKQPLNDTAQSIAIWIKGQTCPPCNNHCNQGRDCPARGAR